MILAEDRLQIIETKAADIVSSAYEEAVNDIMPPVNPLRVADSYNISVKEGPFEDQTIMCVYDRKDAAIYISEKGLNKNMSFMISHMLGHYFLHEDLLTEVAHINDLLRINESDSLVENEATWFAASLLMQKELTEKLWMKFRNVSQVAKYFNVPQTGAYYRIKRLALLEE